MAITSIVRNIKPENFVIVQSSNTLAEVATADYVTAQIDNTSELNNGLWEWLEGDLVYVIASDGSNLFVFDGDDFTTLILYSTAGNGAVTLPVVDGDFTVFDSTLGALKDAGYSASDPAKTKVVMASAAVTTNALAVFADTAGTIKNASTTVTLGQALVITGAMTASGNISSSAGQVLHRAVNGLTALVGGAQAGTALTAQINRVTTVASAADSVQLPAATVGLNITVINAAAANAMAVFPQTGEIINALAANASISVAANKTINFYCAVAGTWNSLLTA